MLLLTRRNVMRYRPLSDEALEDKSQELLDYWIAAIYDLNLPEAVTTRLLRSIDEDLAAEIAEKDHYDAYEQYCENIAEERRLGF